MAPAVSLKENVVVKDGVAFFKNLSAGAVAATVAKTVIAPVERVKLILQLQNAQSTIAVDKRYTGMIDCFVRLPKEQGFLSFWRGNVANIYRSMAQESLGLAFKELFRNHLVGDPSNRTRYLLSNLTCGAAAGVATIAIIYPLDFTRTRLAIDMGRKKKDREFRGIVDCVLKIGRADGIRGLYKGLVPSLQYYVIYRGFYYGLFDTFKPMFYKKGTETLGMTEAFLLAQVVTLIAAMSSYPLDTVRRRLMMEAGKGHQMGTVECAKAILRNEGWRSFFNGCLVNAFRGTGAAIVLTLYNEMSKYM